MKFVKCVAFGMIFAWTVTTACAQVLVSGSVGVAMTVQDLEQDILRVPSELRALTFSRPADVKTNAGNLYVRRVLADEAKASKLDQDPKVKAALDLARDKVLSDARLEQIDRTAAPSDAALLAYAQSLYKANSKRFETPEQIRARHILIKVGTENAKVEAEKILAEINGGANFEELAKARSQDVGSGAKGGDLGFFAKGRMVAPFEEVAFKLAKPGDVSGVVETQFGFHIIKLEEKRPAGIKPFVEVKDSLLTEAKGAVVNEARIKERERIMVTAHFDEPAIEAFAKSVAQSATK